MEKPDIEQLVQEMTLEEKAGLCSGKNWFRTKAVPRLGVPAAYMCDGPAGLRKNAQEDEDAITGGYRAVLSTAFPTGATMAATWNTELVSEAGRAIGRECLAEDVPLILGPAINMKRHPLCGRNFEYLSEDPYLAGKIAAAQIEGIQSQGVCANVKHFAANNQESRRLSVNERIDERTLREIYLAAFEMAVKEAKPATVMCAYNQINGVHCSKNRHLLTEILRDEWGFDGIVMSDWYAVKDRVESLKAGLDLEMPYTGPENDQMIVDAVRDGSLDEAVLDETARRMLAFVFRADAGLKPGSSFDVKAHHALARRVAADGMVLLKNEENLLPFEKGADICVIGQMAEQPRIQGGGSSKVSTGQVDKVLEEMKAYMPQGVPYARGYEIDRDETDPALLEEAVSLAKRCRAAVIFAGLSFRYEAEGYDRADMRFPPAQTELIRAVAAVNPNVAVVLFNGSPVDMPWEKDAKAVLEAYLSGQAAAGAICDLLFGAVNPSGKLAETIPMRLQDTPAYLFWDPESGEIPYGEGIYIGYRYYDKKEIPVRYPFGHGLSYTTFAYDGLSVSAEETDLASPVTVSVNVTNTGKRAGSETVQFYVGSGRRDCPVRELKGFAKVKLEPGETKTVSAELDFRSFAHYDSVVARWQASEGVYTIEAAASSRDIRCGAQIRVTDRQNVLPQVTEDTLFKDLLKDPATRKLTVEFMRRFLPDRKPEQMEKSAETQLRQVKLRSRGGITGGDLAEFIGNCNQARGYGNR